MNENERQLLAQTLIQQYISFGYRIHPLNGWSKSPRYKNWQTTRYDAASAQTEWATTDRAEGFSNVALSTIGLIVVDLDRVKDSSGSWQENPVYTAHQSDWFASCPLQRSGSGGLHCFFRHPANKPTLKNSVSAFAPGVDVRTSGGQCVLSPSRYADPKHPECRGNIYQWVRPLVPMSDLEEIPGDLYDALHLLGEQQAKSSSSTLVSKALKKGQTPNKKLTEKLSRWIEEDTRFDDDGAATCHLVMRWLLKAFDSSVKHDCVSETFIHHPFILDWLDRHPSQAGSWQETVQNAYDIYATPENCLGLEKPRLPVRLLSGFNCKVSEAFEAFVSEFEIKNDLTLNRTVCGELEYLVSLPAGKRNYELLCGGGKSLGSTALVLHRQDMRFLIVKERKEGINALRDLLSANGETSIGVLVGFDAKTCTMIPTPNRFDVYNRSTSPCRSCSDKCEFGKGIDQTYRDEQLSKRVIIITHKMFLSMMAKNLIPTDVFVFIDEGLKSVDDFELTPDVERSLFSVFPVRQLGGQWLSAHLQSIRAKTIDGGCHLDSFDVRLDDGDDYIPKLTRFCFKQMRRLMRIGHQPHMIPHLEQCLSFLSFLKGAKYRAVMQTAKGLKFRSAVRDMNIPNPVICLDGSSSISRSVWRDFEIFRSTVRPPMYDKTVIHCFPFLPTKNQLLNHANLLKAKFVKFVDENKAEALVVVNKTMPTGLLPLLDDLLERCSVRLTRGSVVGSNAARNCSHAAICASVFSDISDYALGAVLFQGCSIPGSEIFDENNEPRLTRWGFQNLALNSEFIRAYTDELYQTMLRGTIRSDAKASYDVFAFVSSEVIAANLRSFMPGVRFVDETGGRAFRLMELFEEKKPKSLQEFLNLAKLEPTDKPEIERCKLIFKLFSHTPAGMVFDGGRTNCPPCPTMQS